MTFLALATQTSFLIPTVTCCIIWAFYDFIFQQLTASPYPVPLKMIAAPMKM